MQGVKRPVFDKLRVVTEDVTPETAPVTSPKTVIVNEFMDISGMCVRYIQPYPPPDFIKFFQQLKHKDVNFVRIPVDDKTDVLYMVDAISTLLYKLTGIHSDKINSLIKRYNAFDGKLGDSKADRAALLNMMNLAAYFADRDNIEFLREPSAH